MKHFLALNFLNISYLEFYYFEFIIHHWWHCSGTCHYFHLIWWPLMTVWFTKTFSTMESSVKGNFDIRLCVWKKGSRLPWWWNRRNLLFIVGTCNNFFWKMSEIFNRKFSNCLSKRSRAPQTSMIYVVTIYDGIIDHMIWWHHRRIRCRIREGVFRWKIDERKNKWNRTIEGYSSWSQFKAWRYRMFYQKWKIQQSSRTFGWKGKNLLVDC